MRTNHFASQALLTLGLMVVAATPSVAQVGGPFPVQVLDISPGASPSNPRSMALMDGIAYFAATDPAHGTELWRSDGTPSGTFLVSDIRPGVDSSSPGDLGGSFPGVPPADLTVVGDQLFFIANDGVHGIELWVSDGTAGGTHMVLDLFPGASSSYPRSLTAVGTTLFFAGCVFDTGCELWKSDGTISGTGLVKDIRNGSPSSFPQNMVALGDLLIFVADNGLIGEELWKSDGTNSGTVLLKDIDPTPLVYPPDGQGRSYPSALTRVGSAVLFIADDGVHGDEIWRTDGTTSGTELVLDLSPGPDSGAYSSGGMYLVGDRIAFRGRTSASGFDGIYRGALSDGTSAGTYVTGTYLTAGQSNRVKLGDFHYFAHYSDATGLELGRSSLSGLDSAVFASIAPGAAGSSPSNLVALGDRIFFSADDQSHGIELWQSDGTVVGTTRVSDIDAGVASSSPTKLIQLGNRILFTATDGASGVELWSFSLNRPPVARAGADLELASGGAANLDGSASSDPDSGTLTYDWRDENDILLSTEAAFTTSLPDGVHLLKLTVSDGESSSADTVQVTVGNTRPLTISISTYENAQGSVTVDQPPATCTSISGQLTTTCVVASAFNSTVTLTANLAGHSTLLSWSEPSCGPALTCTVTVARAQQVTVAFLGPRILTIRPESVQNGGGKVSGFFGLPPTAVPFECAAVVGSNTVCDFPIEEGTLVTLTATPDALSVLDALSPCGWDVLNPTAPPCSPGPIFHNATITATFRRVAPPTTIVRVTSVEGGLGTVMVTVLDHVTAQSVVVPCDAVVGTTVTCALPAVPGDGISLQAMPNGPSILASITGCPDAYVDPDFGFCSAEMTGDATFGVSFKGPRVVTLKVIGVEGGTGRIFALGSSSSATECILSSGTLNTCSLPARIGEQVNIFALSDPMSVIQSFTGCTVAQMDSSIASCDQSPVLQDETVTVTLRGPQTLTLQVASLDSGIGTAFVNTGTASVSCDAIAGASRTCAFPARVGDSVFASAFPVALSTLKSLTGCTVSDFSLGGAGCSPLVINGPTTISATFQGPQPITVNVTSLLGGQGTVFMMSSSMAPISCPATPDGSVTCSGMARIGEYVNVSALPDGGSGLTSLTGCSAPPLEPIGGGCDPFVVDGPKAIDVRFGGMVTVSLTHASLETGRGTVTLSGSPVICFDPVTNEPETCHLTSYAGLTVTLLAQPAGVGSGAPLSVFESWTGTCAASGSNPACELTLSEDTPIGAAFRGPQYVDISFSGGGSGTVSLSSGPVCAAPSSCTLLERIGPLRLLASPGSGSTFQGWSGACAGQGPTCDLALTDDVSIQAIFTSTNRPPVASPGGPYTRERNSAIVFNGAGSSDADGDPLTYVWNFGDGATGTGIAPTHAYATNGVFTVTLTVNDGSATSSPATSTATISNQAPTANAGGPYPGVRNQAITFDGAGSLDPDGDSLTYAWDFGDGATASGATPSHAYSTVGSFTVTLVVNDGTTNSASVTSAVTVANQSPLANAGSAHAGFRNQAIAFNGAGSSDPDGDPLTYSWAFGDGGTATGVAPSHTYANPGTFTVTLTVNDGVATSAGSTSTSTITNRAPTANRGAASQTGTRLAAINFNGTASSDPDGDALTYLWNFGDGATGTGATASHLYASVGAFTVTLTVNDGITTSAPVTASVTITNLAPTVSLTSPTTGSVFLTASNVTLVANPADADGAVTKVEFFAGAVKVGESLTAPWSVTWPASSAGTYALTARVTDSNGSAVTSSAVSVIRNAPPTVSLTAPVNNAQYAAPASITLTAAASDADGTIASVQFFRGSTSLGTDSSSPYTVTWTGAAYGSYTLTAVATDNRGAVVTSSVITVKVTQALAPSADAEVRGSKTGTNYGTATTFAAQQASSTSNQRWTYLKFDLASIPSIGNAKVRVYGAVSATTGTAMSTAVYPVSDTSWTETGLKWNNKPASGTTALSSVAIVVNSTTNRWYELDVTAYLQSEKAAGRNIVTLALKNLANSTPYVNFSSKENGTSANRPHVLIVP